MSESSSPGEGSPCQEFGEESSSPGEGSPRQECGEESTGRSPVARQKFGEESSSPGEGSPRQECGEETRTRVDRMLSLNSECESGYDETPSECDIKEVDEEEAEDEEDALPTATEVENFTDEGRATEEPEELEEDSLSSATEVQPESATILSCGEIFSALDPTDPSPPKCTQTHPTDLTQRSETPKVQIRMMKDRLEPSGGAVVKTRPGSSSKSPLRRAKGPEMEALQTEEAGKRLSTLTGRGKQSHRPSTNKENSTPKPASGSQKPGLAPGCSNSIPIYGGPMFTSSEDLSSERRYVNRTEKLTPNGKELVEDGLIIRTSVAHVRKLDFQEKKLIDVSPSYIQFSSNKDSNSLVETPDLVTPKPSSTSRKTDSLGRQHKSPVGRTKSPNRKLETAGGSPRRKRHSIISKNGSPIRNPENQTYRNSYPIRNGDIKQTGSPIRNPDSLGHWNNSPIRNKDSAVFKNSSPMRSQESLSLTNQSGSPIRNLDSTGKKFNTLIPRSSSVSALTSFKSRSFRDLHKPRSSDGEPFVCSRDCASRQYSKTSLRGATKGVPRGKPIQLWEIQRTLGRGDFIEGVLNIDFSNGADNYICAPVSLGRSDGHLDGLTANAKKIQQ